MNTARRRALGACTAAALALHAGLLLPGIEFALRFEPPPARPVVALRLVEPGAVAVAEPAPAPEEPLALREPPARAPARPRVAGPAVSQQEADPAAAAPAELPAVVAPDVPAAVHTADDGSAASSGEPPPTYPTRIPPSARLRYALWRGDRPGSAELLWQAEGERYSARFEARLDGAGPWIEQSSAGTIDAAGIAPQRFTDRRQRRIAAANFRRDRGVVAWSGAPGETPLLAGAQDRLSWIAQLAAVIAAEPALAEAGARVALPVAGARGDASVWVFVGGGRQPDGTLHLRRERAGPYDLAVEVWLDPQRHHWPSRLRLEPGADARTRVELALRGAGP